MSRLLFYSPDNTSLRQISKGLFSTHPTLSRRIEVINGDTELKVISPATVIHISIIASYTLLFFTNALQVIASRQGVEGEGFLWGLLLFLPTAAFIGSLYGLYFAYQKTHDSLFDEEFGYKKKALVVWISCFLAFFLGNTLPWIAAIVLSQTGADFWYFYGFLMLSSTVFIMAFPITLLSKFIFTTVLE